MTNNIEYGDQARELLKTGIDILANAVKVTLGPKGRNVVINPGYGFPAVTKDGVTVARSINLHDPVMNTGAMMIKEVAEKTADIAGDGTTTATVLAQAITVAGMASVAAGANPMDVKRGIDKAVVAVVEDIKRQSTPILVGEDSIRQVATISANSDEVIGGIIADAINKVGKDGVIMVEDSTNMNTYVKIVEGLQFDKGYSHPGFVNNAKKQVELEEPFIIFHDKKISFIKQLSPLMEKIIPTRRPVVLICDEIDLPVMSTILANVQREIISMAVVGAPSHGDLRHDLMSDMAVLTGGRVIYGTDITLENATLADLGQAERITITQDKTTIIGGRGDKLVVKNHIADINSNIDSMEDDRDKGLLKERAAKLVNGIATIYVGGATKTEIDEKKDRIDDSVHATRAAIEEGIVAGGGTAYIKAQKVLEALQIENSDEMKGVAIIAESLESPLRQICANSGIEDTDKIVSWVKEGSDKFGYDAKGNYITDLIKAGVIDPAKVSRVALENAASIAAMVLTTEALLVNSEPRESQR